MSDLFEAIWDAGLIQFGLFRSQGHFAPIAFHFEMIPSYPQLLRKISDAIVAKIDPLTIERLLCPWDMVVVSGVISERTQVSLVYSRGSSEILTIDFVGAYDVGHPTALLVPIVGGKVTYTTFVKRSEAVGLNIVHQLAIMSLNPLQDWHSLFDLPTYLKWSLDNDLIALSEYDTTTTWIKTQTTSI